MVKEEYPDITIDVCSNCQGVFLDKDELNSLATGLASDIEFCSAGHKVDNDKFPIRNCPKCEEHPMIKVDMLRYSDTIFDHCETCGSFFLDRGEIDARDDKHDTGNGKKDVSIQPITGCRAQGYDTGAVGNRVVQVNAG